MPNTDPTRSITPATPRALRIAISGQVQGLGVRPAIAKLASKHQLGGRVANTRDGVNIFVEGEPTSLDAFHRELLGALPAAAKIVSVSVEADQPVGMAEFTIERADAARGGQPIAADLPVDRMVCETCLGEIQSPIDRRYRYPFTSCVACGPRFSIIDRMPYERSHTTMASFTLCSACQREYEAADDRRFHAQANACPQCGPKIWLTDSQSRVIAEGDAAIEVTAKALLEGHIAAVLGLGGYQLLADATSQEAVNLLRKRKRRLRKPLAVMVPSLTAARAIAQLTPPDEAALSGPAGPIVVVPLRADSPLAGNVANNLPDAPRPTIGLMLASTPLHWLLLDACARPVVCTSANQEGEPIEYRASVSQSEMSSLADLWLHHDRVIQNPIDDSVVRVIAGKAVSLRVARGMTPMRLKLDSQAPLLALGAHQKTTIAIHNTRQAVLGPHIGDLDALGTRDRFTKSVERFGDLYDLEDPIVAVDLHPDYFNVRWALARHPYVERVQHHHGHIVATMLEHEWLDRTVFGVAWDGTGFGPGGGIWGGEFLRVDVTGFERLGHLREIKLVGGERAIREPWRIAVALVHDAIGPEAARRLRFQSGAVEPLIGILSRPQFTIPTSSVGRLFDGVAALVLGIERNDFEGEAAWLLESACDATERGEYPFTITSESPFQLDWRPMVRQLLQDRRQGIAKGAMAMRFHRGLASATAAVCRNSNLPVVLGGGVFQNCVLLETLTARLAEMKRPFVFPCRIPPNDAGIAAGQIAVAASRLERRKREACV